MGQLDLVGDTVTLRFEWPIAASPSATWSALVEPALLRTWLAEAQFHAVVGGEVHLVWPGQGEMSGVVEVCDEPSVIAYTWDETQGTSHVRFEIAAVDDNATTLRLIHSGTKKEDAAGFGAGWHSHLEALGVVLAGGTSSPQQRDERYEALHPKYLEAVADL